MSETQRRPNPGRPPRTPRWVIALVIILVVLVLLVIILHLAGNPFRGHEVSSLGYVLIQP